MTNKDGLWCIQGPLQKAAIRVSRGCMIMSRVSLQGSLRFDLTDTPFCLFITSDPPQLVSWWFSLQALCPWWAGKKGHNLGHNSPNCLVSCSFLYFKVNKDGIPTGKKAPFSKPSQIKYFILVSAIACVRLRQHRLAVASFQRWKGSCLSGTKENHTAQMNVAQLCTTINKDPVGRRFHLPAVFMANDHLNE